MGSERNQIVINRKFINRLRQFYPNDTEIRRVILEQIESGVCDKANLYRVLSQGRGQNNHWSGKREDEMKNT